MEAIALKFNELLTVLLVKKPENEFYKFDHHVRILTINKNRARKACPRTYGLVDKIIMNRGQQDFKDYLYKKRQDSRGDFLETLLLEGTSIKKVARRFNSSYKPFPSILIPNTHAYAYTREEKVHAITINLE